MGQQQQQPGQQQQQAGAATGGSGGMSPAAHAVPGGNLGWIGDDEDDDEGVPLAEIGSEEAAEGAVPVAGSGRQEAGSSQGRAGGLGVAAAAAAGGGAAEAVAGQAGVEAQGVDVEMTECEEPNEEEMALLAAAAAVPASQAEAGAATQMEAAGPVGPQDWQEQQQEGGAVEGEAVLGSEAGAEVQLARIGTEDVVQAAFRQACGLQLPLPCTSLFLCCCISGHTGLSCYITTPIYCST